MRYPDKVQEVVNLIDEEIFKNPELTSFPIGYGSAIVNIETGEIIR